MSESASSKSTAGSASAEPTGAGSAHPGQPAGAKSAAGQPGQDGERVVIRDRRRIDPNGGARSRWASKGTEAPEEPAAQTAAAEIPEEESRTEADAEPTSSESTEAVVHESTGPVTEKETGKETEPETTAEPEALGGLGAELEALRAELEERTRDLQRVTAEYANYRKRVDRDRGLMAEQATGSVLSALLPVLDDLDRARDHGDLVGPFGAVAEQLVGALGKFGLTPFGDKGDPFDPTRHEAVAHLTSPDVTKPTCVDVMRRGYLLGDRMLRPALVAVADPEAQ